MVRKCDGQNDDFMVADQIVSVQKSMPRAMGKSTVGDTSGRRPSAPEYFDSSTGKQTSITLRSSTNYEKDFVPLVDLPTAQPAHFNDGASSYVDASISSSTQSRIYGQAI
jgi:hypothetical protein